MTEIDFLRKAPRARKNMRSPKQPSLWSPPFNASRAMPLHRMLQVLHWGLPHTYWSISGEGLPPSDITKTLNKTLICASCRGSVISSSPKCSPLSISGRRRGSSSGVGLMRACSRVFVSLVAVTVPGETIDDYSVLWQDYA